MGSTFRWSKLSGLLHRTRFRQLPWMWVASLISCTRFRDRVSSQNMALDVELAVRVYQFMSGIFKSPRRI